MDTNSIDIRVAPAVLPAELALGLSQNERNVSASSCPHDTACGDDCSCGDDG